MGNREPDQLRQIVTKAEEAEQRGDLREAAQHYGEALRLVRLRYRHHNPSPVSKAELERRQGRCHSGIPTPESEFDFAEVPA